MSRTTHDLTERAIRSMLRILSRCSPEHQPSAPLLYSLKDLLTVHHAGTPVANIDERLEELQSKINSLESVVGLVNARTKR